jgi:hypothetical protein
MSSLNKPEPEERSEEPRQNEDINSQTTPKRPEHDLQIEEFLKEQYKSKASAGMSNVGK